MTQIDTFPGQGSQKIGMGEELFKAFPEETKLADEILGYSIEELCLEDPEDQLNQTQFTQPALYVVNALSYFQKQKEGAPKADYLAGHSLGEYNALLAAEVFDFATGLKLVQKRGALMAAASGGGMAAVLGVGPEKVREVIETNSLETIDVANLNSPEQTVISGPEEGLILAQKAFTEAGVKAYIPLKVSAPFHSRYMQPAADEFAEFLKGFEFAEPKTPVIANTTAKPYPANGAAELLAKQIASPVRWLETVTFFLSLPEPEFAEVGPGRVLTGLLAKIKRGQK